MQHAHDAVINIRKYRPGLGTVLGIAGGMFLMGTSATIDTGKMDGQLHSLCSSCFFTFTIISVWYHNVISLILYMGYNIGELVSVVAKSILSLLLIIQVYLESLTSID
jgi:hypothetical protein